MLYLPSTKISRLTLAEVELWKEFKNQSGAFRTSLGRQDEEPDRSPAGSILSAKAGYVKINLKSSLDVPLCPNTIIFSVVKGKGLIKDKNEINSKTGKFDMVVGDIFTFPQGSGFVITNTGTKIDLVMTYVKL